MNEKDAILTIKGIIEQTELFDISELPGFDSEDKSWTGSCEIKEAINSTNKDELFIHFDGEISFNISNAGEVVDIELISFDIFETFGEDLETITNFIL